MKRTNGEKTHSTLPYAISTSHCRDSIVIGHDMYVLESRTKVTKAFAFTDGSRTVTVTLNDGVDLLPGTISAVRGYCTDKNASCILI